ncbi:MAG: HD-GYP domain-containing protein [Thermodesulfobacteriota bacterium]|nr:HD-GYP domain-containing protein [Thermodesulfobacteriota bacterium]
MTEKPLSTQEELSARMGTEFVIRFYRLLKGTMIYDRNNVTMNQYAQECLQAINPVVKSESHLFFKIVRDNCFFNNMKIQVRADNYPIFKGFLQEMRKRWIGEIEFDNEMNKEHLKDLIFLLSGLEENNESNYLYVNKQLEYRDIRHIHVGKLEFFRDEEIYVDSEDRKRQSKEVYFKSVNLVKEVMDNVKNQRVVNIRKAKRFMQNAVNAIIQDDSTLLGLANIKNYDEYTFNHSVNVAIYAIAIGQRIGIPKKHLSHLGMAGLFHDIGKTKISKEILNKTGKLNAEEWETIRSHPVVGTEIVMRMKEWGELSTRMIHGAFEHHLRYDLTGYPRLTRKRRVTLFGRIIALSDFYDALGRPRVYNRFPYVSEKILGLMMERGGKDFDPILVKVFVNMIGIFPLGTLVLLNTNEMGIVVQIQEEVDLIDRPRVNLLYYSEGEYRKGRTVDLTEKDETTGENKWTIVKTLDPNEYNINIAEFLI